MILIIHQPREPNYAAGSLDLAISRHTGERPVERLVREPEVGGEFLESSRQRDCASVGTHIDGEKMADAVACGMNVVPLKPCTQRHDLLCEHCGEGPRELRITREFGEQDRFWIEANYCLRRCNRLAMVG